MIQFLVRCKTELADWMREANAALQKLLKNSRGDNDDSERHNRKMSNVAATRKQSSEVSFCS